MNLFEKIQFGVFAVLYGILSLNYVLATMIAIRHYVHMFQLNSYKPKVQIKWIWQNARNQLLVNLLMVALCALLWASGGMIHFAAEMCIFFAIMVHILKPKKAFKTPLVYTNRVKRMLVTTAVICLIPFALTVDVCSCVAGKLMKLMGYLLPDFAVSESENAVFTARKEDLAQEAYELSVKDGKIQMLHDKNLARLSLGNIIAQLL